MAALEFAEGVTDAILSQGAEPAPQDDMIRRAGLWGQVKQLSADVPFVFYAKHIEKNAGLAGCLNRFPKYREEEWRVSRTPSG